MWSKDDNNKRMKRDSDNGEENVKQRESHQQKTKGKRRRALTK